MFKVNYKNTRTESLTGFKVNSDVNHVGTSCVIIVNFEQISHFVLLFLSLHLNYENVILKLSFSNLI